MARDYKHRAHQTKTKLQYSSVSWWKWVLVILILGLFASFLIFLGNSSPEIEQQKIVSIPKKEKPKKVKKLNEPQFNFYTILPETEIVVPDYEIDTRSREEHFGKGKPLKYLIQAGSFRQFSTADKLRANLALMGIESKITKAIVGNVTWNRVVMGPYTQSSKVSNIKKRLRKKGIDTRVTEIKG
jgi:cell division protein FtsN